MAHTINSHRLLPILVLIVASATKSAAAGDPPEVTYRTHANEVRLTFSASDQSDRGVATLQASDFAVVDKELIVRNFQSFHRSDTTKLEIAIVLDGSGSLAPNFRRETSDLIEIFSQTMGVPEENLSLFLVGSKPQLLCAANCRTSHAVEHLATPRAGEMTPLFDTIIYASHYLSQHADHNAQKVLILLSDGDDTMSLHSFRNAVDSALEGAVQIYSVDLNAASSTRGSLVLARLAAATGGRCFSGRDASSQAMKGILSDFQASYVITYKLPSNETGFHDLHILPTQNSNLQFRCRSGYYYADNN